MKQLSEDPWKSLQTAFPKGSVIEGEITNITDFGFFVRVQGDIEGLISKNSLYDANTETLEDILSQYKVGDSIKAVVVEVAVQKQRLSLSRRDYFKKMHKEEIAKAMNISRAPIREAFNRLEKEGFVTIIPPSPVVINFFSLKE